MSTKGDQLHFARHGCSILALEPNEVFVKKARENCKLFSSVTVTRAFFETFELPGQPVDVVLSANAFHWVEADLGYPKAYRALKDDGYFVLLWNKIPQPSFEVWARLERVHQSHGIKDPLLPFETKERIQETLLSLRSPALNSGLFTLFNSSQVIRSITRTSEQYLWLLSSLSAYIELDEAIRDPLFSDMGDVIETEFGGELSLEFVSAADLFVKRTSDH